MNTFDGATFGFVIVWTRRNGQEKIGVDGCASAEEAKEQAIAFAKRCGWAPPKWWQLHRWFDTNPK